MFSYTSYICLLFAVLINCCLAHRILAVLPVGSKSHKNVMVPLIQGLADRNHSVTYLTNFPTAQFQHHPNISEIIIDSSFMFSEEKNFMNFFDAALNHSFSSSIQIIDKVKEFPAKMIQNTLENDQVQQMLQTQQFHLILVNQHNIFVGYPLAWHFKSPFIVISPHTWFEYSGPKLGDSEHTEHIPFRMLPYTDRMTLLQRIRNTIVTHFFNYLNDNSMLPSLTPLIQSYLPGCPSLLDMERNLSLIFTNSHPSISYPRVLPPKVIQVACIQCRPAQRLPQIFEEFIKAAEGFLVFSLGSIIDMNEMPHHLVVAFQRAFANLGYRIIWQWKHPKDLQSFPANVLLSGWIPQQDLLGHPKCKALLTHGGLFSTQETVYHGVPIIGLPFGNDQNLNMLKAVNDGYAIKLSLSQVSEQSLGAAIQEILYNSSYQMAARRLQSLLRDQPESPLERAIFWSEYAIRHDTSHMTLGSQNLNVLQRNLFDVYLIIFALVIVILFLCIGVCVFSVKCLHNNLNN